MFYFICIEYFLLKRVCETFCLRRFPNSHDVFPPYTVAAICLFRISDHIKLEQSNLNRIVGRSPVRADGRCPAAWCLKAKKESLLLG